MFREFFSYFGLTVIILLADVVICIGAALLCDKNNFDDSSCMILAVVNTVGFAIVLSVLILGPITK